MTSRAWYWVNAILRSDSKADYRRCCGVRVVMILIHASGIMGRGG